MTDRKSLLNEVRRMVSRSEIQGRDMTAREAGRANELLNLAASLPASPMQKRPSMKLELRRLPTILAELAADLEARQERRADLIGRMAQVREASERTDAELRARIAPLEKKAAEHRAALEAIELELAPLRMAQDSAAFVGKSSVKQLQAELRKDVQPDLQDFLCEIDELRAEVSGNLSGCQTTILGTFDPESPLQDRIEGVMARTLEAYREAERMAASDVDFAAGIAGLRADLRAAGIGSLR